MSFWSGGDRYRARTSTAVAFIQLHHGRDQAAIRARAYAVSDSSAKVTAPYDTTSAVNAIKSVASGDVPAKKTVSILRYLSTAYFTRPLVGGALYASSSRDQAVAASKVLCRGRKAVPTCEGRTLETALFDACTEGETKGTPRLLGVWPDTPAGRLVHTTGADSSTRVVPVDVRSAELRYRLDARTRLYRVRERTQTATA